MLGLAYLLTPFSCQYPAPCLAHPISASEDEYPASMELQSLRDGKTQVTFLIKAGTSQTLSHSSCRLSRSGCHEAFMSPSFGPLKVKCLVWAKHHSFLRNQKEGSSHRAIALSDTCFRVSCPGRFLPFSPAYHVQSL